MYRDIQRRIPGTGVSTRPTPEASTIHDLPRSGEHQPRTEPGAAAATELGDVRENFTTSRLDDVFRSFLRSQVTSDSRTNERAQLGEVLHQQQLQSFGVASRGAPQQIVVVLVQAAEDNLRW